MEFYAGQLVPDDSEYSTSKKSKVQPNRFGYTTDFRLQMDLYDCVPWGNYELTVVTNSTNQGNAMEKVAWEVENGPDEVGVICQLSELGRKHQLRPTVCVHALEFTSLILLRHAWQLTVDRREEKKLLLTSEATSGCCFEY